MTPPMPLTNLVEACSFSPTIFVFLGFASTKMQKPPKKKKKHSKKQKKKKKEQK